MRTLGKRVGDEPRGFESRPLRSEFWRLEVGGWSALAQSPTSSLQFLNSNIQLPAFDFFVLLEYTRIGRARWGTSGALTPLTWLTRNPLQRD